MLQFGSGDGLIIPTTDEPDHFSQTAQLITFPAPPGGNSHPHMALPFGNEVFVADLVSAHVILAVYSLVLLNPIGMYFVGCRHNLAASGTISWQV
jgi:hypothetical protein